MAYIYKDTKIIIQDDLRLLQRFLAADTLKGTKLDVSKLLLGHHGAKVFTL